MKARRQIFPMLFLHVWLAGWTVGGIAAMAELFTHFEPFLAVWLCFWAISWLAASSALVWMLIGSETLRVVDGDLEYAHHALGRTRRWLYQGTQIRNLRVANQPGWASRATFYIPFFNLSMTGAIKFDYGPRTVCVMQGLDDAEGQMIIDRLAPRLPRSAL